MTQDVALAANIARRIEETADQEELQQYDAWALVAAEIMGYDIEDGEFLRGNDGGIDFFYQGDRVYEVFQCKMHELTDVGAANTSDSFGPEGVNDLRRAMSILLKGQSPKNLDARIRSMKAQLLEDLSLVGADEDPEKPDSEVTVHFTLLTLGDNLSPAAESEADAFRESLRSRQTETPGLKATFRHVGLSELRTFSEEPGKTARKPSKIRLRLAHDVCIRSAAPVLPLV